MAEGVEREDARKVAVLGEAAEEAGPLRLVLPLEDPVIVLGEVVGLGAGEKLQLFLQEQGFVFVVIEHDPLPAASLGQHEGEKRSYPAPDVEKAFFRKVVHSGKRCKTVKGAHVAPSPGKAV